MSNYSVRLISKAHVLLAALLLLFAASAMAQTPSPTPVNPATLPPGQEQLPPPTAPPGSNVTTPVLQPTPTTPVIQEPKLPNFPDVQARPVPPLPDLTRVGVLSSNVVPLSMNDAIRKALQNNNDIEVARDDVRYNEQVLRSLQGVYQPVFSVTPQIIKNITPQQSTLGGSGSSGTTKTTIFNVSPSLTKIFEKGGGTILCRLPTVARIRVRASA